MKPSGRQSINIEDRRLPAKEFIQNLGKTNKRSHVVDHTGQVWPNWGPGRLGQGRKGDTIDQSMYALAGRRTLTTQYNSMDEALIKPEKMKGQRKPFKTGKMGHGAY